MNKCVTEEDKHLILDLLDDRYKRLEELIRIAYSPPSKRAKNPTIKCQLTQRQLLFLILKADQSSVAENIKTDYAIFPVVSDFFKDVRRYDEKKKQSVSRLKIRNRLEMYDLCSQQFLEELELSYCDKP